MMARTLAAGHLVGGLDETARRGGRRSSRRRRAPSSSPRASRSGRRRRPRCPTAAWTRQDGAGHRRDDLDRSGRAGDARGRRPPGPRRRRRAVARDGRRRCDRRGRGGRCRRRGRTRRWAAARLGVASDGDRSRPTPSASSRTDRGGVEPPAAGPRVASRRRSSRAGRPRRSPRRRRGSPSRCAQSSGGQIRVSVSVRASPARTTGWRTSQRRNRRFVTTPRTTVRSSAPASRSSAAARSGPQATILASIGSNRPPISVPSSIPASTRIPSPVGQRSASTRPVAGRNPSSASSA